MHQPQRRELGTRERVRLIFALVVLAGLAAITAVGIGVALHGRSETLDSLEHWQARLEEETSAKETPKRTTGIDSPGSRIRRLEADLGMRTCLILRRLGADLGFRTRLI